MAKTKKTRRLVDENFVYCSAIRYDYERRTDCELHGCDTICRCGSIVDTKIIDINIIEVFEHVKNYCCRKLSTIEEYCVERILRMFKLYDMNNWELSTCNGYYGEEIEGIFIDPKNLAVTIGRHIDEVLKTKSNDEKVKYILELEYGYLLDEFKDKKFKKTKVKKEQLHFGAKGHHIKLDPLVVEQYKGYPLFKAICTQKEDVFRIIDGYHRCAALEDNEECEVLVTV